MSPEPNGLGEESIIIGLTQILKDCPDLHHPHERLVTFLRAIEKHGPEAYRRAVMRKAAFESPVHETAARHPSAA